MQQDLMQNLMQNLIYIASVTLMNFYSSAKGFVKWVGDV